jgi:SAM-dependent methyltransferase
LERKRLGAYYTPPSLVELLVREVVGPACEELGRPPRIVDPACGDGRLLAAAGVAIRERFGVDPRPLLVGVEIDPEVAAATRRRLGVEVIVGDGRTVRDGAPFDVVLGNPPYLSQLAAITTRGGHSALGGGPYADVAAEFLAASLQLARADGGRVGLVLPLSILATRDVRPIRDEVERVAALDLWWWSERPVFDAQVRTGIVGLVLGRAQGTVRRWRDPAPSRVRAVAPPRRRASSWSWLIADESGIPTLADEDVCPVGAVPDRSRRGRLADLARVTADFRDQYYGLVGAVSDHAAGPPLVTCGLIDPGCCHWGGRPVRFAKQRHGAPRVDLTRLEPRMQRWAASRLVPKVLVASQTQVIEAVADPDGAWLPSVPVVSVLPYDPADVWRVAAVLTSPVASAWLANRSLGSGLSARTLRVTAADIADVPLPDDDDAWSVATRALQHADTAACGAAMAHAYRTSTDERALLDWWLAAALSEPREARG